jgi:hypothetical protein
MWGCSTFHRWFEKPCLLMLQRCMLQCYWLQLIDESTYSKVFRGALHVVLQPCLGVYWRSRILQVGHT